MLYKRTVGILILTSILMSSLVPTSISADNPWWNKDWSFKEEIIIPIDTKDDAAKYQPIDITIKFNNICWALDENEHSIRVISENDDKFLELESQVYDLNHTDAEHIDSCNLVFLIPAEANGKEKYYVYYDDEIKPGPDYQKHVDVKEEDDYRYEPIPGIYFESSFYKIIQDGYIVYGINKEGSMMGTRASQQVTKLKKDSKDTMPNNGESIASFNFVYWFYENGEWYTIDSAEKFINSTIFVNGNLMIKLRIISQSNDGRIQTTAVYKYYYCPTENKRLYTHLKQEILKYPLPTGSEIDVSYILLHCGGIKSSTIKELNFGDIPPYFHFYNDYGGVTEQQFDRYPESTNWQQYVYKQDDYDLGSSPWLSVDYGETGTANAIIFESNKLIKSGDDERDGIELQMYESKSNIRYPGLDGRFADIYLMRNAYEKGEPLDNQLPANYVVEFNAEYFTTQNGGYPAVEKEAGAYQKLVSYQPKNEDNATGGDEKEEKEKYSLTAYVHLAPSVPLGSLLSAVLGKNLSYTYAELYKDSELKHSGPIDRLATGKISELEGKTLFEKLKIILGIFDWKNISFFKKIKFSNLEPGTYVIKIYKANSEFAEEKQYIGFGIVDLKADQTIRISCRPQGTINITVLNQDGKGIKNAKILFQINNVTIADEISDENGSAVLKAPCYGNKPYTLKVMYKGFLAYEENNIKLGLLRRFTPMEKTIEFGIYDLSVKLKDSDGKVPSFNLNVGLTSDEMLEPSDIKADYINDDGTYIFKDLYSANYKIKIKYNMFDLTEKIQIPEVDHLAINLYDFTVHITDDWSLDSEVPLDVSLISEDLEKTVTISGDRLSNDKYGFYEIYPGNYNLKVTYKSFTVEQSFNILKNLEAEVKSSAVFNVTTTVLDARGNKLKDAKVLMIRDGKKTQGITDDNGNVIFSIPPGVYLSKVYYNDELIAERKVDVLNEKSYSVVTTNQPLTPFIIWGLSIALLIGAIILSYRKKDFMFFLEILAIILIVLAVFSPWWTINGSSTSPHFETSTNLYFLPTKMVTITSGENVTAGELASLDERFVSVISLVAVVIGFSMLGIPACIILDRYRKHKISLLIFIILLIGLIVSSTVFFYVMSELATITVGSISGNENLDVNIAGENMYAKIPCSWGPGLGFYLLLSAIIILVLIFLINLRRTLLKDKTAK